MSTEFAAALRISQAYWLKVGTCLLSITSSRGLICKEIKCRVKLLYTDLISKQG